MTTRQELMEACSEASYWGIRHLWCLLLRYLFPVWYRRQYERLVIVGERYGKITIVWDWTNWYYDTKLQKYRGFGPTGAELARLHGATYQGHD